jgi:hypothetical protein
VVRSAASANVANGAATTSQMGGSGTFKVGEVDSNNGLAAGMAGAAASTYQDTEYCIQIQSADVVTSDEVDLRIVYTPSTELSAYTQIASFTVGTQPAGNTARLVPVAGGSTTNLETYTHTLRDYQRPGTATTSH